MPQAMRVSGSWRDRPLKATGFICPGATLSRFELLSPSLSFQGLCSASFFYMEFLSLSKASDQSGPVQMPLVPLAARQDPPGMGHTLCGSSAKWSTLSALSSKGSERRLPKMDSYSGYFFTCLVFTTRL